MISRLLSELYNEKRLTRLGEGLHLAAQNAVEVLLFAVAADGHAPREERQVKDESEDHGEAWETWYPCNSISLKATPIFSQKHGSYRPTFARRWLSNSLRIAKLTRIDAEDLHRGERREDPDEKRYHIGERGDRNRDGSLAQSRGHPLRHRFQNAGPPPSCQHHERVVDTDTCQPEIYHHVSICSPRASTLFWV